jgi:hypothetical protein
MGGMGVDDGRLGADGPIIAYPPGIAMDGVRRRAPFATLTPDRVSRSLTAG